LSDNQDFERVVWPHLRAAYNVARWLVHNDHDAEDVVQEAFAKAFVAMKALRSGEPRSWLLAIVRNTAINFVQRKKRTPEVTWNDAASEPSDSAPGPEAGLIGDSRRECVRAAIRRLPVEYRETLVLREIEELSYKDIAKILQIPMGTVMSRLARARTLLIDEVAVCAEKSR
jgi:RNA polymerase sigma-70 factor (ECF subfamily)